VPIRGELQLDREVDAVVDAVGAETPQDTVGCQHPPHRRLDPGEAERHLRLPTTEPGEGDRHHVRDRREEERPDGGEEDQERRLDVADDLLPEIVRGRGPVLVGLGILGRADRHDRREIASW